MADRFRAGKRLWSLDDDEMLRQRYPHDVTSELAGALRRSVAAVYARADKLGLTKSAAYLASEHACRLRPGDHVGAPFWFKKGQAPPNKGLRRPGYSRGRGRMQETQFRKGERSGRAREVYKPVGTERISKDGYLERKVNEDLPFQRRWRAVHLIVWEAANGPLPAGHAVSFRNGDKRDVRIENLALITRSELMARNAVHNLPKPLVETIQLLGALNRQIRKREGNAEKQDRRSA